MMMPSVVIAENILLNRIIIFDKENVLLSLVFYASKYRSLIGLREFKIAFLSMFRLL